MRTIVVPVDNQTSAAKQGRKLCHHQRWDGRRILNGVLTGRDFEIWSLNLHEDKVGARDAHKQQP